jgi:hypothetical protein
MPGTGFAVSKKLCAESCCYFQLQEVGRIRAAERIVRHPTVENGTKPFGQDG